MYNKLYKRSKFAKPQRSAAGLVVFVTFARPHGSTPGSVAFASAISATSNLSATA
jgi:hypothetical protein